MTGKRKKRVGLIALTALLAVSLIGGTFAYWNQTSTIGNPFGTGKYGSTVVENFKPEEGQNWQPGVEINKDVYAENTGDQDLIVRVRLDETWTRRADATADAGVTYKDSLNDPYDIYTVGQVNATDGLTAADSSVVNKYFNTLSANWVDGGDGWYYYKINLEGGQTTDKWLDSVELKDDADMGCFVTTRYFSITDDTNPENYTWVVYTQDNVPKFYNPATGAFSETAAAGFMPVLHNKVETTYQKTAGKDLLGYSQSDYVLTITVETVQATTEAVCAKFGFATEAALDAFITGNGLGWTMKEYN